MLGLYTKCINLMGRIIGQMLCRSPSMRGWRTAISRRDKIREKNQLITKRKNRRPSISQNKRSKVDLRTLKLAEKREDFSKDSLRKDSSSYSRGVSSSREPPNNTTRTTRATTSCQKTRTSSPSTRTQTRGTTSRRETTGEQAKDIDLLYITH